MIKKLLIFILSIMLFLPVTPVFAYSGGLLNGLTVYFGSSINNTFNSSSFVTDNDITTYSMLSANADLKDTLWYNFPSPVNIDSYILKADPGTYSIKLYDLNSVLLYSSSVSYGYVKSSFPSVVNVSYVALENLIASGPNIFEFDVFDSSVFMPPVTPSNLTVNGSGGSGTLTWSASTGATSYKIYDGVVLLGLSSTNSYDFSGLAVGTHNLSVSSVNDNGESSKSSSVSYIVLSSPSKVTGLVVSGSGAPSGVLTWDASPASEQVTGYMVYDGLNVLGSPSINSYSFNNLSVGVHPFAVSAVNTTGEGFKSDVLNYEVLPVPGAVNLTSSNLTSNSLDLNWSDLGSGVTYKVFGGVTSSDLTLLALLPEYQNYYHVSGLTQETQYYYKVVPVNVSGDGLGETISVTTINQIIPLPTTPIGLKVDSVGNGVADLSWSANPEGEQVTSYKLYNYGKYVGSYSGTSAHLTGLANNTKYSFSVAAVNSGGESYKSLTVSATPKIDSTQTEIFNKDSVNLGFKLSDIFKGIGLLLLQLWPIVALGVVIGLSFKLASRLRNLGQQVGKGERPESNFRKTVRSMMGGQVRKGSGTKGYYGNKKLHHKKVNGRSVKMARRSTRKTLGGKRLSRRTVNYGVKRVNTAYQKKRARQKKYGTHKLGYLSKGRNSRMNNRSKRSYSLARSSRPANTSKFQSSKKYSSPRRKR